MSFVDCIAYECICRLKNDNRSTFNMTIIGQEYKIVFNYFHNDNPNDFKLYKDISTKHQTIEDNLNNFMKRKEL